MRALQKISQTAWAIQPEKLKTIATIAKRENDELKELYALQKESGEFSKQNPLLEYRGNSAIINVTGPIFRYANLFTEVSGATSTDAIAKAIGEAENSDAENIIFNFDTPGGEATEISTLAEMIHTSTKPTISYVGAMAASAGYWMASAAERVIISSTGLVGSIGTVATIDLSSDENIIEIVSSQSPEKRLDASTDEGRASIQSMVDKMAKVFIDDVATYRKVSAEHVLTYFGRGGLVIGHEAVAAGMADEVGNLENLIKQLEVKTMTGNKTQIIIAEEDFTADFLETKHNALYSAILNKGIELGAAAERERIQGVKAQSVPGFEDKIESMMFDGKTTAEQAAVALVKALKDQGATIAASIERVQSPIADEFEDQRDPEQKAWDKNEGNVRSKFSNFANYQAYNKGVARGQIKRIGS